MSALLSTVDLAPAADRVGDFPDERDDLVAVGRGAVLDQRSQVAEKGLIGRLVELLPIGGEPDLEAPTVFGMIHALDQALLLELVDDARHGAEPDAQLRRQLA